MKNNIKIIIFILCASCVNGQVTNEDKNNSTKIESNSDGYQENMNIAVKFINEYISTFGKDIDFEKWLKQSNLVTENFIKIYILENQEALENDPEMGFGFDPILSAQDAPEKFEFESFNSQDGFVIVRGVDWEDFRVILKIVQENGNWLVDGSGVINIPIEKQLR